MARRPPKPEGQPAMPRSKRSKRSKAQPSQQPTPPKNHLVGPVAAILIYQDIEKLDPRAAAIISAAFVENNLAMAIMARLRPLTPTEQKRLFDKANAVLWTFSNKIDLGYGLYLYSAAVRSDLDNIREIRNVFAHHLYVDGFDHREVAPRCMKMNSIKYLDEYVRPTGRKRPINNRDIFVDTCAHLVERFALIAKTTIIPPEPTNHLGSEY